MEGRRAELVQELNALRARADEIRCELRAIDEGAASEESDAIIESRARAQAADEQFVSTLRDLHGQGVPVGMIASQLFAKKMIVQDVLAGKASPSALYESQRDRLPALVEEVRERGLGRTSHAGRECSR
jgi:hypothetical protein